LAFVSGLTITADAGVMTDIAAPGQGDIRQPPNCCTATWISVWFAMKIVITILALASLGATAAVAKTDVHINHAKSPRHTGAAIFTKPADKTNMFESESLGHQWFPNPDRLLPVPDHYP
jgi:hypothetical protein